MPLRNFPLPHLRASEILTLSQAEADRVSSARGREREQMQAFADTLRWLDGNGPRPDYVCFRDCIPVRTEDEPAQWVYKRYVIPDYFPKMSKATLIHELLNRFTPANHSRISRKVTWQTQATIKAERMVKRPRKHSLSVLELTQKLVGADTWPTKATFSYLFEKGTTTQKKNISAARLYTFLLKEYSGRLSR